MKYEEAHRLVRKLKTNLYSIRATKVSKYWSSVGKNLEEAIDTVEELDRTLDEADRGEESGVVKDV